MEFSIMSDLFVPIGTEFLGAFLGVIGALWLDKRNARKKCQEMEISLTKELKKIYLDLQAHIEADGKDYYRYATPVWNIHMASNAFSNMDYNKYIQFSDVYSKIWYAQELEKDWSQGALIPNLTNFGKRYLDTLNHERLRIAQEIMEEIKKLTGGEINARNANYES